MRPNQHKQQWIQLSNVVIRWLWAVLFVGVLSGGALAAPQIETGFPNTNNLVTNGSVLTSASFGSSTGQPTGSGIGLDTTTALVDPRFPKVSGGAGIINAIIDDGFGGWVIGGDFTEVGGVELTNLAYIQADFTVSSTWRPNPNGAVRALLFHTGARGLRLLVGGDFSTIHGETRTYFAELNSGSISKPVTDLELTIDAPVRAIVKDENGLVYIGGDFVTVQGTGPRDSDGDGQLDVNVGGEVGVDENKDGIFESRLFVTDDLIHDIDVDGDGDIDLDVDGDGIIDTDINIKYDLLPPPAIPLDTPYDQTYPAVGERQRIAALDLDATSNGMVVDDWNPNVDGPVYTMALAPARGRLYIGGNFTNIAVGAGTPVLRKSIAALNIQNDINIITTWNPGDATNTISINAMLLEEFATNNNSGEDTGFLYVGGNFTRIGDQARTNFAALDISLAVNNANDWDVQFSGGVVNALARTTETIFVGGNFTTVTSEGNASTQYPYLAGLKRADGTLQSTFNPKLNGSVTGLTVTGNTLYVGGSFTTIGDESRLYIGGDFTYIGPSTGSGVVYNPAGVYQSTSLQINGEVYAVAADGANGWYVGGNFSSITDDVATYTRNNLAYIDSTNYRVSTWNPNANGVVRTIITGGTGVYVGGDFTDIGGSGRNYLAEIHATGTVQTWNPNADGVVRTIVADGNNVYAGGDFTNIGGAARNRLAAFDLTNTGNEDVATAWNPNANGVVRSIVTGGAGVYVGGDFTDIGGSGRNYLAEISAAGVVQAWNPNADGIVRALEINGTNIYVGGDFTNIAGLSRNYIAEIDNTGAATGWNPNGNGSVSEILLDGTVVYVGGDFTLIGTLLRNRAAAFNVGSSIATGWNPSAGNTVHALSQSGGNIFIGGTFSSVGGVTRERLAAFDSSSGVLDANFDIGTDATVRTMALSGDGSTLYVGGDFTAVGGQQRNHIAALDTSTGGATAWNPDVDGTATNTTVNAIELTPAENLLYVGGIFETINGVTRSNIGAIDTTDGVQTAWDPAVDGAVKTLALSDKLLLIGGDFQHVNINGQHVVRSRLASLLTETNVDNATSWAPAVDDSVNAMALAGNTLYIGGDFNNINDSGFTRARNRLAALDTAANAFNVLNWNPDANGSVKSVTLTDDALFVGGDFTTVNGTARNRLAAIDFDSGAPLPWWNLQADATVHHLGVGGVGDRMIVAGDFREITTIENFPPYTAPVATSLRRGLTAVDVGFPHAVTNPPAGAYQAMPLSITSIKCIDTPKDCSAGVYFTENATAPVVSDPPPTPPQSTSFSIDTTLRMIAMDNAGNQSALQTALYVIDNQPPLTTAAPQGALPDGEILSSNDTREVTLSCSDNGAAGCAETYYTIDGTDPTDASNVYIAPLTIDQNTTLKYFSFDQARNSESVIKEEQYWVDLTPPTVVADPPTQVFYSPDLSVSLLCSDVPGVTEVSISAIPDASNPPNPNDPPITGAATVEDENNRTVTGCYGVYYTLDDSTPTQASSLYTGSISFSDSTVVKFIAVDRAGNVGPVQRASYAKNYSDNAGAAGPLGLGLLLLPWLCWRARRVRCAQW